MYKQIISSTQVSAWAAGTPAVSVGTVQGCSIKLINQTQYELQVFNGTEQIDTVPPFSFIVSPYENDLNVILDKSNASTVLVSPYQYVAFKRIKGVVSYQTGSTTFPGNTPVAGTVINPTTSPIPTQSQYTPTTYNLGSYTFASTAIPAQSVGTSQFTESVSMSNVVKAQLLVQQTASSGFVDANPGAGIRFQLQGSDDNSTWYVIAGDANNPTSMDIIINGVWDQAADQTSIPAITSGYAYVRWAIYLVNVTTASVTMSESCTVYMQTVEG